jgi:Tol biopolymer transport system component
LAGCGSEKKGAEAIEPTGGNGKIVFSIFEGLPAFNGNDACSGLWAVNPDGSGLMRLTMPDPVEFDSQYYPSFSPDGSRLAFEVVRDAGGGGEEDYAVESDSSYLETETGDVQPIATFTSLLFVNPRLVWSPKNDSVLTLRLTGDVTEIVDVAIKSGKEKVLFDGKSQVAGSAVWAPDGSRIAFWTFGEDGIWLMDSDGANRRKLVAGGEPVWAPDSK